MQVYVVAVIDDGEARMVRAFKSEAEGDQALEDELREWGIEGDGLDDLRETAVCEHPLDLITAWVELE